MPPGCGNRMTLFGSTALPPQRDYCRCATVSFRESLIRYYVSRVHSATERPFRSTIGTPSRGPTLEDRDAIA